MITRVGGVEREEEKETGGGREKRRVVMARHIKMRINCMTSLHCFSSRSMMSMMYYLYVHRSVFLETHLSSDSCSLP